MKVEQKGIPFAINNNGNNSHPELFTQSGLDFKNKYDALFNTIPDGVILIKNSKILYSNKALADLLGYRIDEMINLNVSEVIAPHNLSFAIDLYERRNQGEIVPDQYQMDLIHKNRKTTKPVLLNVGIVGSVEEKLEFVIVKDLSEKTEIESRLLRELELQKYFMDYIPDSIYFKDLENKFIKANKATLIKMGLSSIDELLGKTDFEIFNDEHAIEAKEDEKNIIENRTSIINKIEKETWQDGRVTWASTTKIPLIDENNNVYGTFGITRDITKLKKTEDVKDVLLKISSAVTSLNSIDLLYAFIHNAVGQLMSADNFYIAIYNSEADTISFPYFVDEVDEPPLERKAGNGLTEYVLRSGKAQLIDEELDLKTSQSRRNYFSRRTNADMARRSIKS